MPKRATSRAESAALLIALVNLALDGVTEHDAEQHRREQAEQGETAQQPQSQGPRPH